MLDAFLLPEIQLCDAHSKQKEGRQQPGQLLNSLVRYIEQLELKIIEISEELQMIIVLHALHLSQIEITISSQLESPQTKKKTDSAYAQGVS